MSSFAQQIIRFYHSLTPPQNLPNGVEVLFPQQEPEVKRLIKTFYTKYFSDERERTLLLGINPGRFGAGSTGINFTAPKQLTEFCGIEHGLKMQSELSAEFIYEVVNAYGGCTAFYNDYFIGAVSPLGYVRNGKNINYYDDRQLQTAVTPFIVSTIRQQLKWKLNRKRCICVGDGQNFRFLQKLNETHGFFETIVPLPHPRFILQYKRKQKDHYLARYLEVLQ